MENNPLGYTYKYKVANHNNVNNTFGNFELQTADKQRENPIDACLHTWNPSNMNDSPKIEH